MHKFLLILILTGGLFSYFNILPYHFSAQTPIDPKNLSEHYDLANTGFWHGQEVTSAPVNLTSRVLGDNNANKRIEINLTQQKLYMVENNSHIREFLVSTGKWGKTPTGTFAIWTKLRYVRMRGGNPALGTYYNLPNVPYTMFFGGGSVPNWKGYGIHGTYWHNNFGHPMSHGCINMRTPEAAEVFNWAEVGTPVVIYGTAPNT